MRIEDLAPTPVFDAYWRFAAERQKVFFARMADEPFPWTDDPIITEYRFTNAYRASDRVSQYLIRNVIYDGVDRSDEDVLFRIVLFKLFNKTETWEYLVENLGSVGVESFDMDRYDELLTSRMAEKKPIYSAAYIMPSGKASFRHERKHMNHLELLRKMLDDHLSERIRKLETLEDLYNELLGYPMLGRFLAYQLSVDLNYSELCDFSERDYVVAGPGAVNGISKCFSNVHLASPETIISLVADSQDQEFARREIKFKNLFGRSLQLIDCQNLFCEIDKYARVAFPQYASSDGRTRIKRKYRDLGLEPIDYYYPPKWNLNDRVAENKERNDMLDGPM